MASRGATIAVQAMRRALVWLTPPASSPAEKADAAAKAAEHLHEATRQMLRAGVISRPDDDLAARAMRLRHDLQNEASTLLALNTDNERIEN